MAKKDETKKKTKEERRTTADDRSEKRMMQYAKLALALGCALPFLVPLVFRLALMLSPPTFTEFVQPTSEQLHGIFFSGQPHIIFCTSSTGSDIPRLVSRVSDVAATITKQQQELAATDDGLDLTRREKEKAYKSGAIVSPVRALRVGTLDCSAPLPSGKSVLERFSLTLPPVVLPGGAVQSTSMQGPSVASTAQPLPPAFFVGNGERPSWIPNDVFLHDGTLEDDKQVPSLLVQHVLPRLAPKTISIQSEKLLASKCTGRKACLLVLHSGTGNLLSPATSRSIRALHHANPSISIATVDVNKYTLDLQKKLGKLNKEGQAKWPRMLLFRRQATAPAEGAKKQGKKSAASTLYVASYKGEWQPDAVRAFIVSLAALPSFVASGALADSSAEEDQARLDQMRVLKRSPQLSHGAASSKPVGKGKCAPIVDDGTPMTDEAAAAEVDADLQRERAEQRRLEMEAEAADNSVRAAANEDDAVTEEQSDATEEEEHEEEVVSLDEDRADL